MPDPLLSAAASGVTEPDPVDRLILDEAAELGVVDVPLAVVGDATGALAVAAAERFDLDTVRTFHDAVSEERASDDAVRASFRSLKAVRFGLEPALFDGARLVLLRLPKSLAELDEIARLVAAHAHPEVRIVAGGRIKHMSRGMNETLERSFESVTASLGRQKSRVLHASAPKAELRGAASAYPIVQSSDELGFSIASHGGAFAGPRLDLGTRELLSALRDLPADELPEAGLAVDLGCGTGVLAVALARLRPELEVIASDRSWAAVSSARETVRIAGVEDRVEVRREDAGSSIETGSVDVLLLNPPFHDRHEVVEDMAHPLFEQAARMLRPGASMLTVFNSGLAHRAALERIVGPSTQISRGAKFTVVLSRRRG
ncbi:class I SAM-dependent methyltransferase [Pseudoclavibacter sp. VKM Ac-2888]|uniref:class I SAM-dependent methyltransferase n=1 Tax=Pseudoclavibacter sp. VKM Ac-2888 TaxID=2783830 RepID=UPI001889E5CD|nr:methyltransferase [Pseudoclavibacter sp. VKM Ac-2888]MBF4550875.1 methyltransferase [Pseudoclavibacter sp. VKM Ac-2888]